MDSYVDLIADAKDATEVLTLVNDFVSTLWRFDAIQRAPLLVRPRRIRDASDVAYWLWVTAAVIEGRATNRRAVAGLVYAMQAVFEAAFHRLAALDAFSQSITADADLADLN
jgi:hypothetical protein